MIKLSSRQARFWAVVILMTIVPLGFFFPDYPIAESGLPLVIFLTVFIPGLRVTWLTGILAALLVTIDTLRHDTNLFSPDNLTLRFFSLILILFTTLLALHFKKQQSQLELEKQHMTSLFENATEGIVLADGEGKIVLLNPAAERIFGYSSLELIGNRVEILVPDSVKGQHYSHRKGYYQHPGNRTMGSGRDLFARRKDGSEFPVEVSLSHYRQKDNMYVIAFIVDITYRKKAEEGMIRQKKQLEKITNDIRKLNTELEIKVEERTQILKEALTKLEQSQNELRDALDKERQLNEIKSRFVSMASHEFRTPLSSVLSSASLLAKYTQSEEQEKRNKHINRIKDSVKHLNEILEDFLSLGRLDENKVMVSHSTFDLEELLHETAEELKPVLKKEQKVVIEHSGEKMVHTDKRLVKNILINLSSNAAKFSGEGKPITIQSLVVDHFLTIDVIDKGIGIPEDDQQHLFSSFFRGSNAINIQGTGLGLHIVKRYADLLHGTVHLQSKLDEGTTITIQVPLDHHNL